MQMRFFPLTLALAIGSLTGTAAAGELTVQIANGRATVIAREVPLRQILAEWARVGNTRVVNGEKLMGGPITLELIDIPEKQALDILLRSAAGYMAAPRPEHLTGASQFDRVIILASSQPPAAAPAGPPQPFNNRPAMLQVPRQPPPEEEDDDDGEPGDQGPMPPPGMMPPGGPFPGGQQRVDHEGQEPAQPITSPRPGMLPQQPQPTPGRPFTPGQPMQVPPGAAAPGVGPFPGQGVPVILQDPDGPD